MNEVKICVVCGNPKAFWEFAERPKNKDGRDNTCKECRLKKPEKKNGDGK